MNYWGGQEPACAISENLSIILSIIAYQIFFLQIYLSEDVARNAIMMIFQLLIC
jgi:hypothetical protein